MLLSDDVKSYNKRNHNCDTITICCVFSLQQKCNAGDQNQENLNVTTKLS